MEILTKELNESPRARFVARVALALLVCLLAWLAFLMSTAGIMIGQQTSQKTFSSAKQASYSLYAAVKNEDEASITRILGGGKELVSSGDDLEDKYERQLFVAKYEEMHRLVEESDGTTLLYIGAENWPFPVPLLSSNGGWQFDSDLGKEEVLFRQIGENETTAIQTSHALVQAEKEGQTRLQDDDPISQYASEFVREEKGNNGTQNTPGPFHGYYFRILTGQDKDVPRGASGGLAFIAYPAEYQSSGVLTFIVDQNDVVYEKDLGPSTAEIAKAMTAYDRTSSWRAAE